MTPLEADVRARRQQEKVVRWYPMRIFHSNPKRQQMLNDLLAMDAAVESTYVARNLVDAEDGTYTPALVNYIFIRTSLENLRKIKADKGKYEPLRYVVAHDRDDDNQPTTAIAHVPDKQMHDFMRVINDANEQVVMLENLAFACKPGQKVRIRQGLFEGVEGIVKSIKKHLCVVIPIQDVMAVAITNVPRKYLQRIGDETE